MFTWVFNNTRRSTLAAILLHFSVNLTGEIVALSQQAEVLQTLLWALLVAAILVTWGPRTLAGRSHRRLPVHSRPVRS